MQPVVYSREEFYTHGIHRDLTLYPPYGGPPNENFAQLFISQVPERYFWVFFYIAREGVAFSETFYCATSDPAVRELFHAADNNPIANELDADYATWNLTEDGEELDLTVSEANRVIVDGLVGWIVDNN